MSNNDETVKVAVRPLVELAIGCLGDLSGDLGFIRRQLSGMKDKEIWTRAEIEILKSSLKSIASMCNKTIEDWEEETDVRLP